MFLNYVRKNRLMASCGCS